jgi:hypothetical protein
LINKNIAEEMNKKQLIVPLAVVMIFFAGNLYAAKDYIVRDRNSEDGAEPVITEHRIDVDGDKHDELVKILYGPGVSDKSLTIEVYKGGKIISTLKSEFGIQPNYKFEDVDADGKKEIVIWSGLWDFRMPGEDGITEETYEGHSDTHRYVVATYKFMRDEYYLWDIYTTKKKYEPYCEEIPE